MEGIDNILENVLGVGSVPEGQHGVFLVDGEDGSDLDRGLLYEVGPQWLVVSIAPHAGPHHGVFVPSDFEGVHECELMFVGESEGEGHQGQ